jgi:hypothetical protein
LSGSRQLMAVRSSFLWASRFPFPTRCRDCGKRKFGRTQPDRGLRRSQSGHQGLVLAAKRRLRMARRI